VRLAFAFVIFFFGIAIVQASFAGATRRATNKATHA